MITIPSYQLAIPPQVRVAQHIPSCIKYYSELSTCHSTPCRLYTTFRVMSSNSDGYAQMQGPGIVDNSGFKIFKLEMGTKKDWLLRMKLGLNRRGVAFTVEPSIEERREGARKSLIHRGRNQTTANSIEQQDHEIATMGAHTVGLILENLQDKDTSANLGKSAHELWVLMGTELLLWCGTDSTIRDDLH